MRFRTLALASAAVLAFGVSACAPGTTEVPAGQGTTSAPAAGTSTDPATGSQYGGQATADAAGQAFLHALGEGNATNVCKMMAGSGVALESNQAAIDACAPVMDKAIEATRSFADDLKGAKVTGATVEGTTASFDAATVEPATAKSFIQAFTAVKIDDKWYIGQ